MAENTTGAYRESKLYSVSGWDLEFMCMQLLESVGFKKKMIGLQTEEIKKSL